MGPRSDLEEMLAEQVDWLYTSAERFDSGVQSEAKRMAAVVRTLVHQTGMSHALLVQLRVRDQMNWMSPTEPLDPSYADRATYWSLAGMGFVPAGFAYFPVLDAPSHNMTFDVWWTSPVMKGPTYEFTRRKIVLSLANEDGGSHVALQLRKDYESVSRANGAGWETWNDDGPIELDADPFPSAMRSIAHETLVSLNAIGRA